MAKKRQITETFNINKDSANPLTVKATISAEWEQLGWTWSVDKIHWIELSIADREGIDITSIISKNPRALALIESELNECEEEIIEALANEKTAA